MDVQDPETQGLLARWAGVAVSFLLVMLGLQKWWAKRCDKANEALDRRFNEKANMKQVDEANERITRHKRANEEQITRNYNAVIDLYGKHEATQAKLLDAEQRSSDRFEALMTALNRMKA